MKPPFRVASRAGAFHLGTRAWDEETIAAAGLSLRFPRLVASRTVIGAVPAGVAERMGLPPGTLVVSGQHALSLRAGRPSQGAHG